MAYVNGRDTYAGFEVESESELSDNEEESGVVKLIRSSLWSILAVVVYLSLGTAVLCLLEGFSISTALYITTQVTTTVGYGDVTEDSVAWKIFMVFYIIFGIAIVAGIMNSVFSYFLEASMESARATMKQVEQSVAANLPEVKTENAALRRSRRMLLVSTLILIALVLVWATVFQLVEPCSCSYARTALEGCIEDTYEQCVKTGGKVKDWGSNVYFAVVTFSTVGFGDYSLQSRWGRCISIVLMPMGVLAFLNFVTSISAVIGAYKSHKKKTANSAEEILKWVDKNQSGTLDEQQFMVYYLIKENYVKMEDMRHIGDLFNALDKKDVGALSYDARAMTIEGVPVSTLHAH